MAKKKAEPKSLPKQISDLEEFQATYGEEWLRIKQMPAFMAGLQLLNVRKLNEITALSNEDIERHGLLILASLIGLLKHENDMLNLDSEQSFKLPMDEETIYVSPEEQAAHEQLRARFAEQSTKQRYGNK